MVGLEGYDDSLATFTQLKAKNNALLTYLQSLLAGENQQLNRLMAGQFTLKSAAIASNTTQIVKSGAGAFLGLIATNAGTSWTATVYDNIAGSGFVLVPSTTVALGNFTSSFIPAGAGILCDTGITVVTAGTTPGSLYALYV